jgi:HAD superfamily hydrolase (TIGR01549 family)
MIKNILFDFDGVIIDSLPIREYGFREIFKQFDKKLVDELIKYHNINGGLSRFHKIKYFYQNILEKDIDEKTIQEYATKFSEIMQKELPNKKYLIQETVDFINHNYEKFDVHIVSGSEQNELRYLCRELEINKYFKSINGSPTHKNDLISHLLNIYKYNPKECILIGDSINDYEAAHINGIDFYGYNNIDLYSNSVFYINNFKDFSTYIELLR